MTDRPEERPRGEAPFDATAWAALLARMPGGAFVGRVPDVPAGPADVVVVCANPELETHAGIGPLAGRRLGDALAHPAQAGAAPTEPCGPLLEFARAQATQRDARYRALVEQAGDAMFVHDGRGRLVEVNQTACASTGYPRDVLLSMNVFDIEQGHAADAATAIWNYVEPGTVHTIECRHLRRDGSTFPVEVRFGRLDLEGEPLYLSLARDISDRKLIEDELNRYRHHLETVVSERTAQLAEAKDAAEAATRAKDAFLANMSHEIRTPLNAITGMAYLLRRDGASPEQVRRLDRIEAAGRHLLGLVNDVLELSRIEADKLELACETLDVAAVLDEVGAMLADRARARGLTMIVETNDAPTGVLGDATRIRQALLNFASNALKFTERGSVTLSARVERETSADVLCRFEVRDTGIGIDAQTLSRLFAAFEQADSSTTRRHGGSGLGLAITKRLARLMGGDAGAQSAPGAGSTFWFTATLARARRVSPPAPAIDPDEEALRREFARSRVLLAEDEAINGEVARELLEGAGLVVDLATDGAQAVEFATRERYALILMDVQMPVLDGLQATRRIRSLACNASAPIVAMTANAFTDDRTRCLEAGMDDFLAKPVDHRRLFSALLEWLRSGRARSAPPPPSPEPSTGPTQ